MKPTSLNLCESTGPLNGMDHRSGNFAASALYSMGSLIDLEAPESFPAPAASRRLIDVGQKHHQLVEFASNPWFNDLCGQTPREEAILLAGAPGSNKSTLARQLTLDLASQGHRALMILTEESAERAKAGFLSMTGDWPQSKVRAALGNIHVETGIHDVETLPNFFASQVLNPTGPYHGVSLIVLDSIQGPGLSANNLAAWQALIQFFNLTRAAQVMTLSICHVTKRGEIAGPKTLEHAADCSILIRKAYTRRLISVLKNRFGPETARPLQLEIDPASLRLDLSPHAETVAAVARGYLSGVGLTEVQGAVALPKPGANAKVMAAGLPRREIEQYISGLCQVPGFELADFDLSIQCRLPGERPYRSVLGLPLCLALAGSFLQKLVPAHHLYLGEIDLCRNVRDVPPALLNDLVESITKNEIPTPLRILCPPSAVSQLPGRNGIEVVPARDSMTQSSPRGPSLAEIAYNKRHPQGASLMSDASWGCHCIGTPPPPQTAVSLTIRPTAGAASPRGEASPAAA
jgi:DNA repair protein RadA/Sms